MDEIWIVVHTNNGKGVNKRFVINAVTCFSYISSFPIVMYFFDHIRLIQIHPGFHVRCPARTNLIVTQLTMTSIILSPMFKTKDGSSSSISDESFSSGRVILL